MYIEYVTTIFLSNYQSYLYLRIIINENVCNLQYVLLFICKIYAEPLVQESHSHLVRVY